jgi:hypothetical protein
MKNFLVLLLITVSATVGTAPAAPQDLPAPVAVAKRYIPALNKILEYQAKVADLHVALISPYPLAIVESGQIVIFEPDPASKTYRPVKAVPDTFNIPMGIRAAMPLSVWDNRMVCVVSGEVFDEPRGYVMILHEFVHCYEWDTCEQALKDRMAIFREAMKNKDYMWELQFPFPYSQTEWVKLYGNWLGALEKNQEGLASDLRAKLCGLLSADDWEYMTWQEWKEGLARCLENKISARMGLPLNRYGCLPPSNRVSFYCGGALLVDHLWRTGAVPAGDIEALYLAIANKKSGTGESKEIK